MTKIAHIADTHLRSRQYGFKSRGIDFFFGFKNAVEAAIANGARAILCSGDVVDTTFPNSTIVKEQLPAINSILLNAEIPMYVISGNHDLTEPHWCAHMSSGEDAGIIMLDWDVMAVDGIKIAGLPFMEPDKFRQQLQTDSWDADILMWHGEIKELMGYPKQNTIELADFPLHKWQLIAMGDQHIHRHITREEDGMVVAYPGSTELCSSSEDPEKKLYMYTFTDGKLTDIESIPFATRTVQKYKLVEEVDVEQALTSIEPGALVFVEYNRELNNVIPRLNTVIVGDTILQLSMLESMEQDLSVPGVQVEKGELPTLIQFMQTQIHSVSSDEECERLAPLCCAMVDPVIDHRYAIDKFVEDRLGGKIVL